MENVLIGSEIISLGVTIPISVAICVCLRSITDKYLKIYKESGLPKYILLLYVLSWGWSILDLIIFKRLNEDLSIRILIVPVIDCVGLIVTVFGQSWIVKTTERIIERLKQVEPQIREVEKEIGEKEYIYQIKKKTEKAETFEVKRTERV